jgi:peroxiredoxin
VRLPPGSPTIAVVLQAGDKAPSFTLPAVDGGGPVTDPWTEGTTVLSFFKVSCPVCKMVAPMLTKLSEGGVRVVAVGQDPPETIAGFIDAEGQRVPTVSEPAPFEVSESFGLEAVPSIFLIGPDGEILQAIPGWSRDLWNAMAEAAGMDEPLSTPDDGLRPFRPG